MTRAGYLADFYVYPFVAAALGALAVAPAPHQWLALGCAFAAGVAGWTLLEYVLHRWVFHRAPWIRDRHEEHHLDPRAFVGTPAWLSVVAIASLVLLPSASIFGLATGASFTGGLALAYLAYVAVHYATHHGHFAPGTYLSRLKRRHAIHHHGGVEGNFGVTTAFWDRVFGTASCGHPTREHRT
jgi:sterol desaturase/sphingolipid hydroxylase (fatty acid hydroxylase superfamily)